MPRGKYEINKNHVEVYIHGPADNLVNIVQNMIHNQCFWTTESNEIITFSVELQSESIEEHINNLCIENVVMRNAVKKEIGHKQTEAELVDRWNTEMFEERRQYKNQEQQNNWLKHHCDEMEHLQVKRNGWFAFALKTNFSNRKRTGSN